MAKIAFIILQRNAPDASKAILDNLIPVNSEADWFIVESGSDDDKILKDSRATTFIADWDEAKKNGLRTGRGFNYGLLSIKDNLIFGQTQYDYFVLMTGDCTFDPQITPDFQKLVKVFEDEPRLGILSPVSSTWGLDSPKDKRLHLMFLAPLVCYMFRKECLDKLATGMNYYDYLFDAGENFRTYDLDTEKCILAYKNDWAFGITNEVVIKEDEQLTYRNVSITKSEPQEIHKSLMLKEGLEWMKKKYGFNSKHEMRNWGRYEMVEFFKRHPELSQKYTFTL